MQRTTSFLSALALICLWPVTHASAASCESVTTLNLANTKVTMAGEVAPGAFAPGAAPRGCAPRPGVPDIKT
jgi:hypothetical protein